jgi:hypothetical protein
MSSNALPETGHVTALGGGKHNLYRRGSIGVIVSDLKHQFGFL